MAVWLCLVLIFIVDLIVMTAYVNQKSNPWDICPVTTSAVVFICSPFGCVVFFSILMNWWRCSMKLFVCCLCICVFLNHTILSSQGLCKQHYTWPTCLPSDHCVLYSMFPYIKNCFINQKFCDPQTCRNSTDPRLIDHLRKLPWI